MQSYKFKKERKIILSFISKNSKKFTNNKHVKLHWLQKTIDLQLSINPE